MEGARANRRVPRNRRTEEIKPDEAHFCLSENRGDKPLGSPLRLAAALFGPVVV